MCLHRTILYILSLSSKSFHEVSLSQIPGYQALKDKQGGQRLSPVMREREDKPFYKILQRPQEDSYAVKSSNDPLIKLLSGELGHSSLMTHHPFSIPQGVIHPPHAHSQGVNEHNQGLLPARRTPPKKTSSTRSKQRPATQLGRKRIPVFFFSRFELQV